MRARHRRRRRGDCARVLRRHALVGARRRRCSWRWLVGIAFAMPIMAFSVGAKMDGAFAADPALRRSSRCSCSAARSTRCRSCPIGVQWIAKVAPAVARRRSWPRGFTTRRRRLARRRRPPRLRARCGSSSARSSPSAASQGGLYAHERPTSFLRIIPVSTCALRAPSAPHDRAPRDGVPAAVADRRQRLLRAAVLPAVDAGRARRSRRRRLGRPASTCRYDAFVAPALMASSAMNGAIFDSTGNVLHRLKYARIYDAALATPMGPADVARRRDRLGADPRPDLRDRLPRR